MPVSLLHLHVFLVHHLLRFFLVQQLPDQLAQLVGGATPPHLS